MPGVDWIPGISQLKTTFQLLTGDVDGAFETQKNFVQECPVVSQATSLVQLVAGHPEEALETQKRCLGTVNNIANGMPVVGHVKGAVHHLCGDHKGGNEAIYAASRTAVVMGAGAVAAITTAGLAAIPAGIAAGATYDITSTVITEKPQGYIAAYNKVKAAPSAGNIFDAVCVHVGDGLTGYSGGEAATKLATKMELNKLQETRANMEVISKAEISKLEIARDLKQQQLDAGMFPEPKITDGEIISMGKEINALTKEINTLQGKQATFDLKNGNQVSNNLLSNKLANENVEMTSILETVRDIKQQQLDAKMFPEPITTGEAISLGREINGYTQQINTLELNKATLDFKCSKVSNNLSSTSKGYVPSSYTQDEKRKERNSTEQRYNVNSVHTYCEKQENYDDKLEELDIFKTIHDRFENALKHDYYAEEEAADKQSQEEKELRTKKFAKESSAEASAKSLKKIFGYPNSTRKSLDKDKVELQGKENKNQLEQLISQRVWLHVCMPEEFTYTGVILLNNMHSGLYHSVIRHHDDWAHFIPSFETELQHSSFDDLQLCLKKIKEAKNYKLVGQAIKNYIKALSELRRDNYERFLEVQSSFFHLQLDLYSFIQNNITYENYLGEGVTMNNEIRVFFKVKDNQGKDKVMAVGVSSNNGNNIGLFPPENEFGDNRPIRRIETAFIMSWDTYLKQKVSKIFDKTKFLNKIRSRRALRDHRTWRTPIIGINRINWINRKEK